MKLTAKNYYKLDKYLSNSKISDYLKDSYYFYRKHIIGEISNDQTVAMLIGSAVDEWLTHSESSFSKKYVMIERLSKDNQPGKGKIRLTSSQYDEVVGLCEAVQRTTAYKQLKGHKKQQILQVDQKMGIWEGLKGRPDWYYIDKNGVCTITDLKTAGIFFDVPKYERHAEDFGYFRQMAFYSGLLAKLHPEIKEIICRHLVVMKQEDIYPVRTFIFNPQRLTNEKSDLNDIIDKIIKTDTFAPQDATWENAEVLGGSEYFE